jgi:hypothetical protein
MPVIIHARVQVAIPNVEFPLLALSVDGRKAHLIRREVFALPGSGDLDISDAAVFHRHSEDRGRIARRHASWNGIETCAVEPYFRRRLRVLATHVWSASNFSFLVSATWPTRVLCSSPLRTRPPVWVNIYDVLRRWGSYNTVTICSRKNVAWGRPKSALEILSLNYTRPNSYSFLPDVYHGNRVGTQFDSKVLRVI